ncbi:ROK family protein [Compostimonas suwonensis]|uniref:Putative NBD/HSP70 family sugar kinase n=1 Tax=Compostimonas suwonensis TaxID=1048394 RepID=A0A2M9BVD1_9MICO|nr:ROK family protein [Compostimonas suwonensis]PJJ61906.1 putative NBD/HSP70 family sugar kinase [Compostimonas suwonensis]
MRLGIDIGGTKTAAVAMDANGRVTEQIRMPTGWGGEAVVDTAVRAVTELAGLTGVSAHRFDSIGIGIPGQVERTTGRVSHAVNLGVDDLDLGGRLAGRLGIGVRVENDVKAAALGAYHLLALDGSMAFLNVGTGLAAGIVFDGRLWRGARGTAGEVGHMTVDPSGIVCACGQRGCLETVASGAAIARDWPTSDPLPVRALFDAADTGDGRAIALRDRMSDGLAMAIRNLVLTVDVDRVVIGGGISAMGSRLLDEVLRALRASALDSPFIASLELGSRVQLMPLGSPAAAVGAALVGVGG